MHGVVNQYGVSPSHIPAIEATETILKLFAHVPRFHVASEEAAGLHVYSV